MTASHSSSHSPRRPNRPYPRRGSDGAQPPRRAANRAPVPAAESSRLTAARILGDWLQQGRFPDRALDRVRKDRPFIMELTLGAVRRFGTLHWLLCAMVPRPPRKPLAAVAYVGFYQLLYMRRDDIHATVHETVDAAHRIGSVQDAGLINALLRRLERERDHWLHAIEAQPDPIRLSHPAELLHRWRQNFGRRGARLLCEWNNKPPEVTIRVRTGIDIHDYVNTLRNAGIDAQPHSFAPTRVLVLPRGVRVEKVPGFEQGAFYVQDPSTLAAVDLLDLRPGERVLDACAAPGGKTIQMAECLQGDGVLVAVDMYEDRLDRLRANLARMGRSGEVTVRRIDAAQPPPGAFDDVLGTGGRFDAILLDVPCSNTGVIRRRPDARWHLDQRRMNRLNGTQRSLLDATWPLLKPGGRVVYSTCSLEPEEDEALVEGWCRTRPEARFVRAVKLVPHRNGTDGAYAARIERRVG